MVVIWIRRVDGGGIPVEWGDIDVLTEWPLGEDVGIIEARPGESPIEAAERAAAESR